MLTLGAKLRKLRELRNLKQEYMAEQLGISANAYGKMERDETEISPERLEQIAKALNISVHDIIAFDDKIFFNVQGNYSTSGYVFNQHNTASISDNERKLYEDKIALMQEIINQLKAEVERLRKDSEQ